MPQIYSEFDNLLPQDLPIKSGVYYLSEVRPEFEVSYLKARKKEKRVLNDEEVISLPDNYGIHQAEWQIRKKSADFLKNQISKIPGVKMILEIGCGNGWFSNYLAKDKNNNVAGIDINEEELLQAGKLFSSKNCRFFYYDLSEEKLKESTADAVIFNSSFQYFSEAQKTIDICLRLLKPSGKIFISDSPFYTNLALEKAKLASRSYYRLIESDEMIPFYHHHSFESLKTFNWKILNDSVFEKILNPFQKKFPLIQISK